MTFVGAGLVGNEAELLQKSLDLFVDFAGLRDDDHFRSAERSRSDRAWATDVVPGIGADGRCDHLDERVVVGPEVAGLLLAAMAHGRVARPFDSSSAIAFRIARLLMGAKRLRRGAPAIPFPSWNGSTFSNLAELNCRKLAFLVSATCTAQSRHRFIGKRIAT